MVEALIKKPSAALYGLVTDPVRRVEIVDAIQKAVEESFLEDSRRAGRPASRRAPIGNGSGKEQKRRAHMCLDLFERTVGDSGWGPVHYRDRISAALRHELDNGHGSFDPAAEGLVWTPQS